MSNIINVIDILEDKVSLSEAKGMVIMHKGEAFTFFDKGCTRHVFTNKDRTKVIKLLEHKNSDFNSEEYRIYTSASDEDKVKMTRTEIVGNLIEQDFCMPIKFGGKKLSISERLFAMKCRNEVGWTSDGELVCFDLDEYMKY